MSYSFVCGREIKSIETDTGARFRKVPVRARSWVRTLRTWEGEPGVITGVTDSTCNISSVVGSEKGQELEFRMQLT